MAIEDAITQLLLAHREGNREASDKLFALAYQELHGMAHRQMRRGQGSPTLNTTALVHEAYLKIVDHAHGDWQDRTHFMAVMATVMRHILVDYARQRKAEKRGGKAQQTLLRASVIGGEAVSLDVLDLDASLSRLAQINPRLSQLVEMRFFGGLTLEETANALEISIRTAHRDWYKAKGMLSVMLREK